MGNRSSRVEARPASLLALLLWMGALLAPIGSAQERDEASAAWEAAQRSAPGREQDGWILGALAGLRGAELEACIALAYRRFVELSDEFELERATALARALFERTRAPWSAANLGTVLRRRGRFEEARQALSQGMLEARGGDYAALRSDRALVAIAAGWEARARDDLGSALARGSRDAAVVLGRVELAAGRFERARALFRSVLGGEPRQPWALRGWGLSMLPSARARL